MRSNRNEPGQDRSPGQRPKKDAEARRFREGETIGINADKSTCRRGRSFRGSPGVRTKARIPEPTLEAGGIRGSPRSINADQEYAKRTNYQASLKEIGPARDDRKNLVTRDRRGVPNSYLPMRAREEPKTNPKVLFFQQLPIVRPRHVPINDDDHGKARNVELLLISTRYHGQSKRFISD